MGYVANDSIGFASVSLAANVYTQLPDIVCTEIGIGALGFNITVAGSENPGSNAVQLNAYLSGQGGQNTSPLIMIPTGGNANNLFMNPGNMTETMPFMWHNLRTLIVTNVPPPG